MQLVWDEVGKKTYEAGVSKVVLFPMDDTGAYTKGVAWDGVTGVTESPSGAEATKLYANNNIYASIYSTEIWDGTIEAYKSPKEFDVCDGTVEVIPGVSFGQQRHVPFGLCWRTEIGSDTNSDAGYKIHIAYNAVAAPSEKAFETYNESPDATTLSWDMSSTPVSVAGYKPVSTVTINSLILAPAKLKLIEDLLYGTESKESELPTPAELITLIGPIGG